MNNILNFNTKLGITIYEYNNQFYFDLKELASILGYQRPATAVSNFKQRNKDIALVFIKGPNNIELANEPTTTFFMQRSSAQGAREWQWNISNEVLLPARQMGLKALKSEAARQLVATNYQTPALLEDLENVLGEEAEQFCRDNGFYRVLGYLPPSAVSPVDLATFWRTIEKIGIENFDTFFSPKYHNSYTQDGKWYAFKPDQFDTIEWDFPEPAEEPSESEPDEHEWPSSVGELI